MVVTSAVRPSSALNRWYSPHKFSPKTRNAPSEFQITFAEDGVRYEYGFSLCSERVEKEWLTEYVHPRGRIIFQRDYDKKSEKYEWRFSSYFKGQRLVWSESTRPDALFLSTAIQLNSTQLRPVYQWFQSRLVIIAGGTTMNAGLTFKTLDQPDGKDRVLPFLQEADLGIVDVSIQREPVPAGGLILGSGPNMLLEQNPGQSTPNLVRVTMSHWDSERSEQVKLDFADESHGTQTLFVTAGAWLNVFANGEVLLFDEIDTSLHPLLIRFLIQKFHSSRSNRNNAQLIFSTHNTSLLNQDLLRRDQVWFVEKDASGASRLYPLTDFSPRSDEALERGYMRGRYGAVPVLSALADG